MLATHWCARIASSQASEFRNYHFDHHTSVGSPTALDAAGASPVVQANVTLTTANLDGVVPFSLSGLPEEIYEDLMVTAVLADGRT